MAWSIATRQGAETAGNMNLSVALSGADDHTMQQATEKVHEALLRAGLLLQQDKTALNVVALVTGETLSGSWWSHPNARLIFAVLSELAEQPDVLFTKLLYGKVTLMHRKLWPALLTVASGDQPWQVRGLSAPARRLLASVNESKAPVHATGTAVKELERRILVHSEEVHSESGRHEIVLQPWSAWARLVNAKPLRSNATAKQQIEAAAAGIGVNLTALPWLSKSNSAA